MLIYLVPPDLEAKGTRPSVGGTYPHTPMLTSSLTPKSVGPKWAEFADPRSKFGKITETNHIFPIFLDFALSYFGFWPADPPDRDPKYTYKSDRLQKFVLEAPIKILVTQCELPRLVLSPYRYYPIYDCDILISL